MRAMGKRARRQSEAVEDNSPVEEFGDSGVVVERVPPSEDGKQTAADFAGEGDGVVGEAIKGGKVYAVKKERMLLDSNGTHYGFFADAIIPAGLYPPVVIGYALARGIVEEVESKRNKEAGNG